MRELNGKSTYAQVRFRLSPLSPLELYREAKISSLIAFYQKNTPEFYKPIEEAALNALNDGPLISGTVERVKIELIDGDYDPENSNELAFRIATSIAIGKGLREADPAFMEPIMLLTVISPDDFVGDIIADINTRRGHIFALRKQNEFQQEILAEVPLSELFGYATRIRSLSQDELSILLSSVNMRSYYASSEQCFKRIRGYA